MIIKGLEKLKYDLSYFGYSIDSKKMSQSWYELFKKTTQIQKLYWHLITYGHITTREAQEIYGIAHPPKRIQNIRDHMVENNSPYKIVNVHMDGFDRWDNKCRYDEYTMQKIDKY